jgi:hypothetical protein
LERHGPAQHDKAVCSQRKLRLVANDRNALIDLLYDLSERDDCYYVKYSTKPKNGIFLARCFLTTDAATGNLWAELKPHPKFICTIQEDDFTKGFRPLDDSI